MNETENNEKGFGFFFEYELGTKTHSREHTKLNLKNNKGKGAHRVRAC